MSDETISSMSRDENPSQVEIGSGGAPLEAAAVTDTANNKELHDSLRTLTTVATTQASESTAVADNSDDASSRCDKFNFVEFTPFTAYPTVFPWPCEAGGDGLNCSRSMMNSKSITSISMLRSTSIGASTLMSSTSTDGSNKRRFSFPAGFDIIRMNAFQRQYEATLQDPISAAMAAATSTQQQGPTNNNTATTAAAFLASATGALAVPSFDNNNVPMSVLCRDNSAADSMVSDTTLDDPVATTKMPVQARKSITVTKRHSTIAKHTYVFHRNNHHQIAANNRQRRLSLPFTTTGMGVQSSNQQQQQQPSNNNLPKEPSGEAAVPAAVLLRDTSAAESMVSEASMTMAFSSSESKNTVPKTPAEKGITVTKRRSSTITKHTYRNHQQQHDPNRKKNGHRRLSDDTATTTTTARVEAAAATTPKRKDNTIIDSSSAGPTADDNNNNKQHEEKLGGTMASSE